MSQNRKNAGFTLVELLIVVIILGILAAVVIPQFNTAAAESREAAVSSNLATIRQAIELYKVQHTDNFPTAAIINELTQRTDVDGTINALSGKYGPYLRNNFPANPVNPLVDANGNGTVSVAAAMPAAADDSTSWLYASDTGEFRANATGQGPSQTDFFDL